MTSTIVTGTLNGFAFAATGDTLVNNGTIAGTVSSTFQNDTVANAGRIDAGTSSATGVFFANGGAVSNQPGAFIGGYKAIAGAGAGVQVVNAGTVTGATSANGLGAYLAAGGTIGNQATGRILGAKGIVVRGGGATISNAGTIRGEGGTAISLAAGFQNTVTATPGAAFEGLVDGGNTIGGGQLSTLVLESGTGNNLLSGLGTKFTNFAQVSIASGAVWAFTGGNTLASGATLTSNGTAFAALGTFANAGLAAQGLFLGDLGTIANQASGTIAGTTGVYAKTGTSALTNAGRISGDTAGGTGVLMGVSNILSVNNLSGGTIAGFKGVFLFGGGSGATNAGRILGDTAAGKGVELFGGAGLVNQSGGTVAGKFAVYGGDGATVSNAGSLAGLGSNGGAGVSLKASGTVGNLAGGEISGFLGVYAGTGAATVTNDGRILGDTAAGFGIVLNNGGSLGNQAGGAILGHIGLLANAAVSVSNAGSIAAGTATGDAGLRLNKGGSVSNATGGTIFGGYGIDAGGASVAIVNAGRIGLNATTALAVKVQAGGTLTNLASGTVIGLTALIAGSAPFSVVNAGRIDGQTLSGGGVSLTAGGLVSNQSGGTIQAGVGVRVQGGAGTVANDGRIAGFAGAAVSFAAGFANRAIVGTGASFLGAVDGGNTIGATAVSTLELASGASAGTLTNLNTSFVNFGQIAVDSGATWTLSGQNTVASGVTVANSGTLIASGTLINGGVIGGGVGLATGAVATNLSTGTISGPIAIAGKGAGATIVNQGIVAGGTTAGGRGIALAVGGLVTNKTGGTISGLYGVYSQNSETSVLNAGGISGGGTGNAGVVLKGGGTLTNQAGGAISGETGVRVLQGAATVANAGTIGGTGGTAVAMAAGYAQRAIVSPGAVFSGLVDGGNTIGATVASTLELATGAGIGTLTNLASAFTNFSRIVVDTSALWAFAGGNTIGTGVTFASYGSLFGTLANAGLVQNGLAFAAGGYIANQAAGNIGGTIGVAVSGGAGTVFNAGSISGSGGTAVSLASGFSHRVVAAPGGAFTGIVQGGNTAGATAVSTLELISAAPAGTLSGLGSQFLGFGRIQIDAGAAWAFTGANTIASGTTLSLAAAASLTSGGSLVALGSVVNAGTIQQGLSAGANGFVTNQSGGTIAGKIAMGGTAAGISVANRGAIQGATTTGGFGVSLRSGGLVTNQSGGTVTGRTAIGALTGALTVANSGVVAGYGVNSVGVSLSAGGKVNNQFAATVSGATGVRGGASPTTVINFGTISGATAGGRGVDLFGGGAVYNQAYGRIEGETGISFYNSGGTVTNLGTVAGSGGTAVSMAAGYENLVRVAGGAVFSGLVDGGNAVGGTAASTLQLTAYGLDGTLSGLGSNFVNFQTVEVGLGALWTLTGSNALTAGQTLINNGSLILTDTTIVTDVLLGKGKATLGDGGRLTVGGSVAAGETIGLDGASAGLFLSTPTAMSGAVTKFGLDDTIDLAGVAPETVDFFGGSIHFGSGYSFALSLLGGTNVRAVSDGAGGALLSVACFAAGTRIGTDQGPVAVEDLRIGDRIALAEGGSAPAVWIGRRTVDCARHPDPMRVWPVRVRAGAFGPGAPACDLILSPDHAVFVEGMLVPIRLLIDGAAIVQEPRDKVTYFHAEVPEHAVILAEGLPVESYLDTGDRSDFEGSGAMRLFPMFGAGRTAALWETMGAAPLVLRGPDLERARAAVARAARTWRAGA